MGERMRDRPNGVGWIVTVLLVPALLVGMSVWHRAVTTIAHAGEKGQASTEDIDVEALRASLDEILTTQEEILGRFDAILEEARIVKVRATRRRTTTP